MTTLGSRLKRARGRKGLTQEKVAEFLGITNGAVSGYERNYRDPDTETLTKLANLYEVSLDDLLGNDVRRESLHKTTLDDIAKRIEDETGVTLRDDPVIMESLEIHLKSMASIKKHNKHS